MDVGGMGIASAIALVPNDLATGHFFAALTFVLQTFAQALLFRGMCFVIHAVEFDHAVVLVAPVNLGAEAAVDWTGVRLC